MSALDPNGLFGCIGNLLNKRPPRDGTNGSYAYYDQYNYNGYGRSPMAEFSWTFN